MQVWLRRTLLLTLVITGVALYKAPPKQQSPQVVSAIASQASFASNRSSEPLPGMLPRNELDPARSDPFVGIPTVPKKSTTDSRPHPIPTPVPQVEVAPPPVMFRFLGRMINPQGRTIAYLTNGSDIISVSPNTQLADGYTVESITQEGVHLHHRPKNIRAVIAISPAKEGIAP